MSGHGQKLSRRRELAVGALLTRPTVAEAAAACGISDRTLQRWLKDKDFSSALRDAQAKSLDQALDRLKVVSGQAVATLQTVMNDETTPAAVRVSAARCVLETALRAAELRDLADRLAELEAAVAGLPGFDRYGRIRTWH